MLESSRLEDALTTLYDAEPQQFITRRRTLVDEAKEAGDAEAARQIATLRKPTAAAHAVNHLDEDDLRGVLDLGERLRAAQERLDAEQMKALNRERRATLARIMRGLDVSAPVGREVEATLLAATADADAARAVRSRTLASAIRYSGWGDVGLSDAAQFGRAPLRVASTPSAGPAAFGDESTSKEPGGAASAGEQDEVERRRSARRAVRDQAARATIEKARADVARAERRSDAAEDAYAAARAARRAARADVEQARERLDQLLAPGNI